MQKGLLKQGWGEESTWGVTVSQQALVGERPGRWMREEGGRIWRSLNWGPERSEGKKKFHASAHEGGGGVGVRNNDFKEKISQPVWNHRLVLTTSPVKLFSISPIWHGPLFSLINCLCLKNSIMKQKMVKLLFIQCLLLTLELKLPEILLLLVAFWWVFVGKYILTTVA